MRVMAHWPGFLFGVSMPYKDPDYMRKYRDANREIINARKRGLYKPRPAPTIKHKPCEQCGESFEFLSTYPRAKYCSSACGQRAWRVAHPGRQAMHQRKWGKANRERLSEYHREWLGTDEGYASWRASANTTGAKCRGAVIDPDLTTAILAGILLARTCERCPDDTPLHDREIDHKIPIALGGEHTEANIQILCKPCHKDKTKGNSEAKSAQFSAYRQTPRGYASCRAGSSLVRAKQHDIACVDPTFTRAIHAQTLLDTNACADCEESLDLHDAIIDHKLALRLGGMHTASNVQLLCKPCNRVKTREDRALIAKLNRATDKANAALAA